MSNFLSIARTYHAAGLAVMPANRDGDDKRVALRSWKPFQTRLPLPAEIEAWFSGNGHNAVCIATGDGSGNLEMIDFDQQGEAFDAWAAKIDPDLFARLYVESTPSGGRHVVYRCQTPICKNLKLAQRKVSAPGPEPVTIKGKTLKPRKDGDGWVVTLTLIETRGHKGMFLCAPSPGYETMQGDLANLPTITEAERDALMIAADSLNEIRPEPVKVPGIKTSAMRPGDDYSARGDVEGVLVKWGWVKVRDQDNEYWRRPGKNTSWSATLKNRVFYVHSSNAAPFEADKAYGPFAVYALLEHGGDFTAAANALRGQGYGDPITVTAPPPAERPDPNPDPGDLPAELLRVPGFISEVMDHCLATAPYPNQTLAFCGALAMQAFLAGQRITDDSDSRTNLYIVALANSGTGKDHPRKVNQRIARAAGIDKCLGDQFASGQGLEDRMLVNSSMLYQVDEMDALLSSINSAKDARHEVIVQTLLKFYTSSNGEYGIRDKSGMEASVKIEQPSLCLFGTAVPRFYYQAMSSKMLNNGFFARLMIFEAGRRGKGQTPAQLDVPERIIKTAEWWGRSVESNLAQWYPQPKLIEQTASAVKILADVRKAADERYEKAEGADDPTAMAIWARAYEKTRKLALIYAASADHEHMEIGEAAVRWAWAIVEQLTMKMLFQAGSYVADNPFDADCLKVLEKLRGAKGSLPHSILLKRMKIDTKKFTTLIDTLKERGSVQESVETTATNPRRIYRLAE